MKTYLYEIVPMLKRWSKVIDEKTSVKKVLCDRKWRILNDDGFLIFNFNGEVKLIHKGDIELGTWVYNTTLKGLEVYLGNSAEMYDVAFLCKEVIALQKTGTNYCSVLLDDGSDVIKRIVSMDGLEKYLIKKVEKERREGLKKKDDDELSIAIVVALIVLGALIGVCICIL